MILRRAGLLTITGVCAGVLLGFGLARMVTNLLYQVRPDDPVIFGTLAVAITSIALLASWIPALRASQLDPITALRDK
jgi:putative ABC transport system permease protein